MNSVNPYEAPINQSSETKVSPRFVFPCGEMVIVAAIIGGLVGLLFPAVEAARETNGAGPTFPNLMWLHQRTFPLPIVVLAAISSFVAFIAFRTLRAFAPESVVIYFPWWKPKENGKTLDESSDRPESPTSRFENG